MTKIIISILSASIFASGGWQLGAYISDVWSAENKLPIVIGLSFLGIIIGGLSGPILIFRIANRITVYTQVFDTSKLLSISLGILVGLFLGLGISFPFIQISGWIGVGLPLFISLFSAYVGGVIMMSPNRDIFQQWFKNTSSNQLSNEYLIDTSAIIDGRFRELLKNKYFSGSIIVPNFILKELQSIADSSNIQKRDRGRKGLELLDQLQTNNSDEIKISQSNETNLSGDVDNKLVELALNLMCTLITTDYNLTRVAELRGINVLNIHNMAFALKPILSNGDKITLAITQTGTEPNQGVGYLNDGTMVIVESGKQFLNKSIEVKITRILQTPTGCMMFATSYDKP
tara:strand:+ start:14104 stop:15138 length:1035 start_codon:yes stop_codon:yes gene_type:complete